MDGRTVYLKFLLGEKHLFSVPLNVAVHTASPAESVPTRDFWLDPLAGVENGLDGRLMSLMPVEHNLERVKFIGSHVRYAPRQYTRHYIDFSIGKDAYLDLFSSKTKSGLNRKVKKFEQLSGVLELREFRRAEEMDEFFRLARQISAKTYQEKLLNAGLPATEHYLAKSKDLASRGQVRAYLLSSQQKPVSYLYCPADNDTLIYAYLGYDPEFARYSPGGVLHWLVFQKLFDDGDFRFFDFGQGEGEHKKQFSSHSKACADVYFLKKTFSNVWKILLHAGWESFVALLTQTLDSLGLKDKLKKIVRQV